MKITFLGTGTSQGVPFIGCDCEVCTSTNPKDNRLRTSVWIETPEASIVIDSGPDFRQQMLRANVRRLDAIVFTHGHKDHTAGMDDVRAYNYHDGKAMQVYANEHTQEADEKEVANRVGVVIREGNDRLLSGRSLFFEQGPHHFLFGKGQVPRVCRSGELKPTKGRIGLSSNSVIDAECRKRSSPTPLL